MDLPYDYFREETERKDDDDPNNSSSNGQPQPSLNSEIQDAYKAFSSSPWGSRIGGFLGTVVKQVGHLYAFLRCGGSDLAIHRVNPFTHKLPRSSQKCARMPRRD